MDEEKDEEDKEDEEEKKTLWEKIWMNMHLNTCRFHTSLHRKFKCWFCNDVDNGP